MELITTFGFPFWSTHAAPCPVCFCTHDDWDAIAGISPTTLPWILKTFDDYEEACARCEFWRVLPTPELFIKVRGSLVYDASKSGNRGRVLAVDMPELGLVKGDRLEPHPRMPDVGEGFDNSAPSPDLRVLFWRRSLETSVRRRCPLFSRETGIVPEVALVVDWLHTLALGVYKWFITRFWHALFAANVFSVGEPTRDGHVVACFGRLRELLFAWYAEDAKAGRVHAPVQDLTPAMVGASAEDEHLGSWGAETNGLLLFCEPLMRRYADTLVENRVHFERGLESLLVIHRAITNHKHGRLPVTEVQRFADSWKIHLHAVRALAIGFKPKHHAVAHMVHKLLECGTPHVWANWTDESDNRLLVRIALQAHRLVWARRILSEHRRGFGVRSRSGQ